MSQSWSGRIWSLALILSITAPVPPAHLSFIDGILVFLPVSGSSLKMMIFVLAPELHHRPGLGVELLHRQRDGVHLLHELGDARREAAGARARDEDPEALLRDREVGLDPGEELEALLGLLGVVPLVVLPEDLVGAGRRRPPSPSSSRRPGRCRAARGRARPCSGPRARPARARCSASLAISSSTCTTLSRRCR